MHRYQPRVSIVAFSSVAPLMSRHVVAPRTWTLKRTVAPENGTEKRFAVKVSATGPVVVAEADGASRAVVPASK